MSCAAERGEFPEWKPEPTEYVGRLDPIARYVELYRENENGVERPCGCHADLAIVFAVKALNEATSPRRQPLTTTELKRLRDEAEKLRLLSLAQKKAE